LLQRELGERDRVVEERVDPAERVPAAGDHRREVFRRRPGAIQGLRDPDALDVRRPEAVALGLQDPQLDEATDPHFGGARRECEPRGRERPDRVARRRRLRTAVHEGQALAVS
jgi:hypothetical protein